MRQLGEGQAEESEEEGTRRTAHLELGESVGDEGTRGLGD